MTTAPTQLEREPAAEAGLTQSTGAHRSQALPPIRELRLIRVLGAWSARA